MMIRHGVRLTKNHDLYKNLLQVQQFILDKTGESVALEDINLSLAGDDIYGLGLTMSSEVSDD